VRAKRERNKRKEGHANTDAEKKERVVPNLFVSHDWSAIREKKKKEKGSRE